MHKGHLSSTKYVSQILIIDGMAIMAMKAGLQANVVDLVGVYALLGYIRCIQGPRIMLIQGCEKFSVLLNSSARLCLAIFCIPFFAAPVHFIGWIPY